MSKLLFKGVFGSHLYKLDTPESDTDYKAVYMPDYRDIILGNVEDTISTSTGDTKGKNGKDDIDMETFSLQQFVKLACQGQTCAIDMLHTPPELTLETSPEWEYLVNNRHLFYCKNMNSFMGYVKKQAAKYGIKGSKLQVLEDILKICDRYIEAEGGESSCYLTVDDVASELPITEYTKWVEHPIGAAGVTIPDKIERFYEVNGSKMHNVIPLIEFANRMQKQYNGYGDRAIKAKENNGIDWKAVSHALRAAFQLQSIYVTGEFSYPLHQTQYLADVKAGKLDYTTEVAPVLERLVDDLAIMAHESSLPEEINEEFWNNFVYRSYISKSR